MLNLLKGTVSTWVIWISLAWQTGLICFGIVLITPGETPAYLFYTLSCHPILHYFVAQLF